MRLHILTVVSTNKEFDNCSKEKTFSGMFLMVVEWEVAEQTCKRFLRTTEEARFFICAVWSGFELSGFDDLENVFEVRRMEHNLILGPKMEDLVGHSVAEKHDTVDKNCQNWVNDT